MTSMDRGNRTDHSGCRWSGITRQFTVATVDRPMWFIDGAKKIEIARGSQVRFSVAETDKENAR